MYAHISARVICRLCANVNIFGDVREIGGKEETHNDELQHLHRVPVLQRDHQAEVRPYLF